MSLSANSLLNIFLIISICECDPRIPARSIKDLLGDPNIGQAILKLLDSSFALVGAGIDLEDPDVDRTVPIWLGNSIARPGAIFSL